MQERQRRCIPQQQATSAAARVVRVEWREVAVTAQGASGLVAVVEQAPGNQHEEVGGGRALEVTAKAARPKATAEMVVLPVVASSVAQTVVAKWATAAAMAPEGEAKGEAAATAQALSAVVSLGSGMMEGVEEWMVRQAAPAAAVVMATAAGDPAMAAVALEVAVKARGETGMVVAVETAPESRAGACAAEAELAVLASQEGCVVAAARAVLALLVEKTVEAWVGAVTDGVAKVAAVGVDWVAVAGVGGETVRDWRETAVAVD